MFEPEVREVLQELLVRSEAGEVKWLDSASAGMSNTTAEDYLVLLPNTSINIFRVSSGTVRLNFIDSAGDVSLGLDSTDEDGDLLKKIFTSASRIVTAEKTSKTLDDVRKALSQKGPVGEIERRNFPF